MLGSAIADAVADTLPGEIQQPVLTLSVSTRKTPKRERGPVNCELLTGEDEPEKSQKEPEPTAHLSCCYLRYIEIQYSRNCKRMQWSPVERWP